LYDKFVEKVVPKVKALRQGASIKGDECDCGSMTMPTGVEKIESMIDEAVSQGAVILAGGKRKDVKRKRDGEEEEKEKRPTLFFEPTVLGNVNHKMKIVQEEAFGPVMLLLKFTNDEEVIEMANDSVYGLGCSIFSNNRARAERMAKRICSGMCTINDFGVPYLVQALPFGGCKVSGFGRFNGPEGLRAFCNLKSVVTDRFPIMTVPRFTKYPVPTQAKDVVKGLISILYEDGISAKINAGKTLHKYKELLG